MVLRDIGRLMHKEDVMPPLIALMISVLIAGVLTVVVKSSGGRWAVYVIFGGIALAFIANAVFKVKFRYCELCKGHCPNPLCHGVVQRSEHAPRGFVVCPTCRSTWPSISRIAFKATSRQW